MGKVYKGDKVYIDEVLKGRTDAFSFLVDHHKDRAFNLAFRICGKREEAEEIIQDSFMKAFRSLGSFKMKSSFSTWLYRIVYNTAVSSVRSGNKPGFYSIDDFTGDANFLTGNTAEEQSDREHLNTVVNAALQVLDEEARAIITFYYFEELTVDEISGITGLTNSAVKVRLFRSRQRMLEFLEKRAEFKN